MDLLYVGTGGFFGAVTRHLAATRVLTWLVAVTGWSFPFGTLFVNVTGSLLLGAFLRWSVGRLESGDGLLLLVGTGFFGAYTTYSTFAVESITMLRSGAFGSAALYIIGMLTACLLAAGLGYGLADALFR